MPVPFQPANLSGMLGPAPGQPKQNPQALLAALNQHPGFQALGANAPNQPSPWVNNFLTGPGTTSGPQGQDALTTTSPPRMEGQGPSNPNAPIPGLPQPALQQTPGNSIEAPAGNPMTSRSSQPDSGNPPGTSGPSAKLTFGFGDDLTTPQLQAIQAALTSSLVNAQQTNEKFQNSRKKALGGMPAGSGVMFQGGRSNTQPVPNPVPQSSPNDPWTGPSSR